MKSNENDFDAEAITKAGERENMRFVPIKTNDQLDLQGIHRARDRLISRRGRFELTAEGLATTLRLTARILPCSALLYVALSCLLLCRYSNRPDEAECRDYPEIPTILKECPYKSPYSVCKAIFTLSWVLTLFSLVPNCDRQSLGLATHSAAGLTLKLRQGK